MLSESKNILVWLPSPMGDAILCTPALRAIRQRFNSNRITFLAGKVVKEALSPCKFTDDWLELKDKNVFVLAKSLRQHKFTQVIFFKNSFGSALTCFLARIPVRIGYARDGRGFLLTERLQPPRLPTGEFKPISIVDYYLDVASSLGADVRDRTIELTVEQADVEKMKTRFPQVFKSKGPVIFLVPGAAAGPSKRWPADRFAKLTDWLITEFNATVILSVAPNADEKKIAEQIMNSAAHEPINLGETPISLGELKALYAAANLVICNDTGPRHIAIGLKRKVITLVGPNDPAWTDPGYKDEIFIKGTVPCYPCNKPYCNKPTHLCMEAITIEMVCQSASKVLESNGFENRGGL